MGFTVEAKSPNSHVIHLDVPDTDWEQWVLLTADRHFDSKHCNRKLMKRHMDLAIQRDALIIDAGDFFDAMQGFYDPRKNYDELRPEYVATNYLDAIVTDAGKWFEPYADRFAVIAMDNHETNLERRTGTNLVQRLVQELNGRGGQCMAGEYSGYVLFRFRIHKTKRAAVVLKYHHGMGSNAPVTRGVIGTNRMAVMFPDADILVSGHNHESWIVPIQRERIRQSGKIYQAPQWHVRVPSYKNGWESGKGFDVEKMSPKPVGCVWLRFYLASSMQSKIGFEFSQMLG